MPVHLHPTAPLAERVLVPGDPGRALHLAQTLLAEPKMFNHNRGLWGYTGTAQDGELLTVQSTGMGGPSAAIIVAELADLGARRLMRVGTCRALDGDLTLGDILTVAEALAADGTSRALGAGDRVAASPSLLDALAGAGAPRPAIVVSSDLFYEDRAGLERSWVEDGAVAVEMVCAAIFAVAGQRGLAAGSVLIVSDLVRRAGERIEPDALRTAEERAGALAVAALC